MAKNRPKLSMEQQRKLFDATYTLTKAQHAEQILAPRRCLAEVDFHTGRFHPNNGLISVCGSLVDVVDIAPRIRCYYHGALKWEESYTDRK